MVEVATPDDVAKARHIVNEREDYLNGESAGRVMSVTTERDGGRRDCTIYAPTATVVAEGIM